VIAQSIGVPSIANAVLTPAEAANLLIWNAKNNFLKIRVGDRDFWAVEAALVPPTPPTTPLPYLQPISDSSTSQSSGFALAAGLGVGAGVLVLVIIVALVLVRRRRAKAHPQQSSIVAAMSTGSTRVAAFNNQLYEMPMADSDEKAIVYNPVYDAAPNVDGVGYQDIGMVRLDATANSTSFTNPMYLDVFPAQSLEPGVTNFHSVDPGYSDFGVAPGSSVLLAPNGSDDIYSVATDQTASSSYNQPYDAMGLPAYNVMRSSSGRQPTSAGYNTMLTQDPIYHFAQGDASQTDPDPYQKICNEIFDEPSFVNRSGSAPGTYDLASMGHSLYAVLPAAEYQSLPGAAFEIPSSDGGYLLLEPPRPGPSQDFLALGGQADEQALYSEPFGQTLYGVPYASS